MGTATGHGALGQHGRPRCRTPRHFAGLETWREENLPWVQMTFVSGNCIRLLQRYHLLGLRREVVGIPNMHLDCTTWRFWSRAILAFALATLFFSEALFEGCLKLVHDTI